MIYPTTTALLGLAYALCRRLAEALPILEEGEAQAPESRIFIFDTSTATIAPGTVYLLAGRIDEAAGMATRTAEFAAKRGFRGSEARASILLGEICARRDPPEVTRADDHYQQALALSGELGMRPLVAHCHLDLGALYRCKRQQAQEHFAAAAGMYREMDMGFYVAKAKAALATLG